MREAMFNRLRQFNPSRIFESCGGRAELIVEPLHIRQWLVGQWDTHHSPGLCRTSGTRITHLGCVARPAPCGTAA
jgi:hypothetical protein